MGVYLAWLAISCVGLAAIAVGKAGHRMASAVLIAIYGAFGLDGLAHYILALCSDHTLVANLTVWSEAVTGVALLSVGSVLVKR